MPSSATKQPSALPTSLALIGSGKMGGAMLEGWIATGLKGEAIQVVDPNPPADLRTLAMTHRFRINPSMRDVEPPQVLVLAIKPQMLEAAAPMIRHFVGPQTLVISILAGKTIANLRDNMPAVAVVRAMPNLPSSIRWGVSGAFASPEVQPYQKAMADALLKAVGTVEWLEDENLIDAVTAVSGSGPAYVFHLTECLAQAGIQAGLPHDLAERLAAATVVGSGQLILKGGLPPTKLRQNVTSPGGTTAAALDVLMPEHSTGETMMTLMVKAVAAAKKRAEDLSG